MSNWFECKVRFDKMQENGTVKRVNEPYLVDALSFTEAEARIIEELTPFISGEFSVSAVKRTKLTELRWDETGDRWYMVKVDYLIIDEKGNEKKSSTFILVQASDFRGAFENFVKNMETGMADYEIQSITETPLMDVYRVKLGDK